MYTQEEGKERKTLDMSTSNISTGDRKAFNEQLTADNATSMVEILKDNASPLANDLYAALDMPFVTLVGQIFAANTKLTSTENRKVGER
jgi:hypothetical protein